MDTQCFAGSIADVDSTGHEVQELLLVLRRLWIYVSREED